MEPHTTEQILAAGKPLSGKWKLEILYCLSGGPARWNELTRRFPDAAPNALTRQLRQLEQSGLILRTVHSSKPPKVVEYRLTALGQEYIPFLSALRDWTETHRADPAV